MTTPHQFGGQWTTDKLAILRDYLNAYRVIFAGNERARTLSTLFVDAFAGTGYRTLTMPDPSLHLPFSVDDVPIYDPQVTLFQKGSAQIALETEPPFHRYLFIEKNPEYSLELERLRLQFPHLAQRIEIVLGEANTTLQERCRRTDWSRTRAVVFLDPYGMEVDWVTIEAIARTQAIDLWILFPLGQAVNRILTRRRPPEKGWADRLTKFFGTTEWREAFYRPSQQISLFDDPASVSKEATFQNIGDFFIERLRSVFVDVVKNPLYLRNSRNVPIYLLCFAAANKKGAPIAVKIANDIIGKWR